MTTSTRADEVSETENLCDTALLDRDTFRMPCQQ
jgi:hypothetical protein